MIPLTIDPAVVAMLPREAILTLQVSAGDLHDAFQARAGGPEWLSTVQAAEYIGGSTRVWREWADAGLIAGAAKEGGEGRRAQWRLPNQAAREHYALHLRGAVRKPRGEHPTSTLARGRRGPRETRALTAIAGGKR